MEQQIIYISTDRLLSHPENPRKDLGDLTELADSIRQKGVLQNLTVVPIDPRNTYTSFTVVIGHRRLAAAKIAGLTSLPCVVTDMTYQEQLETMLLENMQRTDLTVYEQAMGFQQLSMLGAGVAEIADKTGFSQATVRRRLKMAALDHETLKEVSARQISMTDFDKLYEIEDPAVQNECLKEIGTSNFDQKVSVQLRRQNCSKMLPKALEELKRLKAKEISRSDSYSGKYNSFGKTAYYHQWDGIKPLFEEVPTGKQIYYQLDKDYGWISLYVASERAKPVKRSHEEIEREKQIEEAWKHVDELTQIHYDLRKHFIENLSVTTRNFDRVMEGALSVAVFATITWFNRSSEGMHKLLGTDSLPYEQKNHAALDAANAAEPGMLARIIYCTFGDDDKNGYCNGYRKRMPEHTDNLLLDLLYDWLVKLGYEPSDDERAMRDGSHEIFRRGEDADSENPGKPCEVGDDDEDDCEE